MPYTLLLDLLLQPHYQFPHSLLVSGFLTNAATVEDDGSESSAGEPGIETQASGNVRIGHL